MTIKEKLQSLGIVVPKMAPKGVGNYVSWTISNNILYTSGQLPWKNGEFGDLAYTGRVGSDLNVKEGYECARICAINAIAQLMDAVGDLERVKKIIRLDCHIQAAEGFKDHSDVLDGASDVMNQVFGERGIHTRSAIGMYQSPLDVPVIVYLIAEID
ncbi:RidA family protein [Arenibacter troitsensis]|uniref:Enamine deaminase RidA, house cleaning of reactive enamine intermediates, YjgF/YER057c/UK114 family n=1 Tax=Arenibacter troitsensis TaxID=188872 RepID=A0A1X7J8H1_9FLAO|nr:RidA family protein [Arenibacter troitsensis]MDX1769765.1 RidA family protein [Arenibacter troitsensis]SMG23943.1 Enamine deaminase RidA, house cleaning of reactive enamine intermediates, YjgF/YER057c/UK114 family [Arenibacter troitsensis]